MDWLRVGIIAALQGVVALGIWITTWGYANWPSTLIETSTFGTALRELATSAAGLPVIAAVFGVALVFAALLAIAIYLFRLAV